MAHEHTAKLHHTRENKAPKWAKSPGTDVQQSMLYFSSCLWPQVRNVFQQSRHVTSRFVKQLELLLRFTTPVLTCSAACLIPCDWIKVEWFNVQVQLVPSCKLLSPMQCNVTVSVLHRRKWSDSTFKFILLQFKRIFPSPLFFLSSCFAPGCKNCYRSRYQRTMRLHNVIEKALLLKF